MTAGLEKVPVRGARVVLTSDTAADSQIATSDDEGRFVFGGLPQGRYSLQAFKPLFLPSSFGATRVGRPGNAIVLTTGQSVSGLVIYMAVGSVIEGRVLDQNGDPIAGASVTPMLWGFSQKLGGLGLEATPSVVADDRGVYRAYGLAPGEYVLVGRLPEAWTSGILVKGVRQVSSADVDRVRRSELGTEVTASLGKRVVWVPIFYPGTPDVNSAIKVAVTIGEERTGIDFPIIPQAAARVTGTVLAPHGSSLETVQVTIAGASTNGELAGAPTFGASTRVSAEGQYSFEGVPPGLFVVRAQSSITTVGPLSGSARAPVQWATSILRLTGQDLDLHLVLQPALRVAGHIAFDPSSTLTAKDLPLIRVSLHSLENGLGRAYQPTAAVGVDSTFSIDGVIPGPFRIDVASRQGQPLYLSSATLHGSELLDGPFNIDRPITDVVLRLTNRPSELRGELQDVTGRGAADYFIVVFASDRTYWTVGSRRVKQVRPAIDGSYVLTNLPSGEYYVAALTDLISGDTADPTFLAALITSAVRVNVKAGAITEQSLRIGRVIPRR